MVRPAGLEPATYCLEGSYSAPVELRSRMVGSHGIEPHLRSFTAKTRIQPVPLPIILEESSGPDPDTR